MSSRGLTKSATLRKPSNRRRCRSRRPSRAAEGRVEEAGSSPMPGSASTNLAPKVERRNDHPVDQHSANGEGRPLSISVTAPDHLATAPASRLLWQRRARRAYTLACKRPPGRSRRRRIHSKLFALRHWVSPMPGLRARAGRMRSALGLGRKIYLNRSSAGRDSSARFAQSDRRRSTGPRSVAGFFKRVPARPSGPCRPHAVCPRRVGFPKRACRDSSGGGALSCAASRSASPGRIAPRASGRRSNAACTRSAAGRT
jgi:hypothetical protein